MDHQVNDRVSFRYGRTLVQNSYGWQRAFKEHELFYRKPPYHMEDYIEGAVILVFEDLKQVMVLDTNGYFHVLPNEDVVVIQRAAPKVTDTHKLDTLYEN